MTITYCKNCKKETKHRHMHNTAYDLEGTHMSGSERYVCLECGHSIHKGDVIADENLKFILD